MKCENCGCEHNGEYGTGRFCSKHCRMSFISKKSHNRKWTQALSIAKSKRRKNGGWKCYICGECFDTKRNLKEHIKVVHGFYQCKFCNERFTDKHKLGGHTRLCKLNPQRDEYVKCFRNISPHRWSDEERKRMSKCLKRFYEENPESASYKKNHYTKCSYAEDYFQDFFENDGVLGWVRQYRLKSYRLDFAFVDDKIDFEIDGHQHYVDKRIVQHDIERTKEIENLGWKVVRIRWSMWQSMSEQEKKDWVQNNLYSLLKR